MGLAQLELHCKSRPVNRERERDRQRERERERVVVVVVVVVMCTDIIVSKTIFAGWAAVELLPPTILEGWLPCSTRKSRFFTSSYTIHPGFAMLNFLSSGNEERMYTWPTLENCGNYKRGRFRSDRSHNLDLGYILV